MPKLYRARTSFVSDGVPVTEGDTAVEGHPVMRGREALFEPFAPTFGSLPEVTRRATPARAPGTSRSTSRAKPRA